jgi:hypothetical protein
MLASLPSSHPVLKGLMPRDPDLRVRRWLPERSLVLVTASSFAVIPLFALLRDGSEGLFILCNGIPQDVEQCFGICWGGDDSGVELGPLALSVKLAEVE